APPPSSPGSWTPREREGAVARHPRRIAGGVGGRAEVEQTDGKVGAARPLESAAEGDDPAGVVAADGVGIARRNGGRRAPVLSLRGRIGGGVAGGGVGAEGDGGTQQRPQQDSR